jgi:hypothetical protein
LSALKVNFASWIDLPRLELIAVVPMAGLSAAVGYVALFTLYPSNLGG